MKFDTKVKKAVVGKKITALCSINVGEDEDWPGLELEDGSVLIIQQDGEGNGPGVVVVTDKNSKTIGYIG